ncbi:MAG: thioester domain-containing protein [Bryobacterales bacterium]|nr:thioester domain-containing protein [Bryobacterales bacterium]
MKTKNQVLMTLIFVMAFAGSVAAGTITARVDGLVAYGQVQMSLDGGTWANNYAGLIRLVRTGGTSDLELFPDDTNFVAFCVEPRQGISLNQTYTWEDGPMTAAPTSLGGMTVVQANQLRVLMGLGYPSFFDSITALQAAAIQVAIWEIVEEKSGTLNVYDGSIKFRNPSITGILDLAQSLLDQVNSLPPTLTNLRLITSQTNQDLMIQVAGPEADTSTPEPATLSMLGLGLFALGLAKRRISGANAA